MAAAVAASRSKHERGESGAGTEKRRSRSITEKQRNSRERKGGGERASYGALAAGWLWAPPVNKPESRGVHQRGGMQAKRKGCEGESSSSDAVPVGGEIVGVKVVQPHVSLLGARHKDGAIGAEGDCGRAEWIRWGGMVGRGRRAGGGEQRARGVGSSSACLPGCLPAFLPSCLLGSPFSPPPPSTPHLPPHPLTTPSRPPACPPPQRTRVDRTEVPARVGKLLCKHFVEEARLEVARLGVGGGDRGRVLPAPNEHVVEDGRQRGAVDGRRRLVLLEHLERLLGVSGVGGGWSE